METENRLDNPEEVEKHKNRFLGGKALIVLGGPSGIGWKRLRNKLKPDVLITCNGGVGVRNADYWVLGENMNRKLYYALKGKERYQKFVAIFDVPNTAKIRMINFQNWERSPNYPDFPSIGEHYNLSGPDVIKIRRVGYDEYSSNLSLREYGEGFLYGPLFKKQKELGCRIAWRVGTVAIHCVHLAGILGCSEVHTIGYDLCFPKGRSFPHHWYSDPDYEKDSFRTENVFTHKYNVDTQWDWIEGAEFVASVEHLFIRDGLKWIDHSGGLLSRMGVWCAK
jgi:hypothetical protein